MCSARRWRTNSRCWGLHVCRTFAAGQQRLFDHHRPGDDGPPHTVRVLQADRAGRADLGTGAAADAQRGGPQEVEVGEPAGRRVGHAQGLHAHLAARGHAQAAADAGIAAQSSVSFVQAPRCGQARSPTTSGTRTRAPPHAPSAAGRGWDRRSGARRGVGPLPSVRSAAGATERPVRTVARRQYR